MARYCTHCGNEVNENAVVCVKCGCEISEIPTHSSQCNKKTQISTSEILGAIGIVAAWLFALGGHVASIIGIVLGIKEYKETEKMTGLILSIIGEVCSIFSSIIGAAIFSALL